MFGVQLPRGELFRGNCTLSKNLEDFQERILVDSYFNELTDSSMTVAKEKGLDTHFGHIWSK